MLHQLHPPGRVSTPALALMAKPPSTHKIHVCEQVAVVTVMEPRNHVTVVTRCPEGPQPPCSRSVGRGRADTDSAALRPGHDSCPVWWDFYCVHCIVVSCESDRLLVALCVPHNHSRSTFHLVRLQCSQHPSLHPLAAQPPSTLSGRGPFAVFAFSQCLHGWAGDT